MKSDPFPPFWPQLNQLMTTDRVKTVFRQFRMHMIHLNILVRFPKVLWFLRYSHFRFRHMWPPGPMTFDLWGRDYHSSHLWVMGNVCIKYGPFGYCTSSAIATSGLDTWIWVCNSEHCCQSLNRTISRGLSQQSVLIVQNCSILMRTQKSSLMHCKSA
jgi:hypothetical protein